MITLVELNHTLTKVEVSASAVRRHASPERKRELQELLQGVAWILSEDIENIDSPHKKEARRQLRIETVTLLREIEAALRHPTDANRTAVIHRTKTWAELLRHVRPTLGIPTAAPLRRRPLVPEEAR